MLSTHDWTSKHHRKYDYAKLFNSVTKLLATGSPWAIETLQWLQECVAFVSASFDTNRTISGVFGDRSASHDSDDDDDDSISLAILAKHAASTSG